MKAFHLQRAPSAQNAVALIGATHEETVSNIIALRDGTPPSYENARALAPKLMMDGDINWSLSQCDSIVWELQKKINKELLESIGEYRSSISPKWYRRPDKVKFEGSGLSIALQPLGVWSDGEQLFVDWLQPWKYKSLTSHQQNILYTLHKHRFLIGTYFDAKFRVVEFCAHAKDKVRGLTVIQDAFSELSDEALDAELRKLLAAVEEAKGTPKRERPSKPIRKDPELPF